MNLLMNTKLSEKYKSNSQKIRVMTENWLLENSYCPNCGNDQLSDFENTRPVADFYCQSCKEEFELKSKKAKFSNIINDGTYDTMIRRLESETHPNFFFLNYSKEMKVYNFLIIPKQFFTPSIIIKRNPLAPTAKRAGWTGCNIDISAVPNAGKVFLIQNGEILDRKIVQMNFEKTLFLREQSKEIRGWTLEVLSCIDKIPKSEFSLNEVYHFEKDFRKLYPNNKNIQAKIRQQLQILRDRGLIEFVSRGKYKKTLESESKH